MVFATRMEEWEDSEGMVEVRALCGVEGAETGMGPDDDIWEGSWD
jgi:hypothetical protein